MTRAGHRAFGIIATVVVIAAVAWGFAIVGSPESRRLEKLDERRLDELQAIAYEARELVYDEELRSLKRDLFDDLPALVEAARRRKLSAADPETGEAYGYRVLGPYRFELCATFDGARDAEYDVFWNHPAGRHCFVIDVRERP